MHFIKTKKTSFFKVLLFQSFCKKHCFWCFCCFSYFAKKHFSRSIHVGYNRLYRYIISIISVISVISYDLLLMTHDYDIISGKCIWNLYRFFLIQYGLSIWFILGDSLWLRSGGTLWSWACCLSPAGNTAIQCLQLRYSGNHFDPEVAVRVWRGTLRSRGYRACSLGRAGNALILSLLFKSGGEHCDLELAVEVRRESLWSRGCCSGPVRTTAIWTYSG